MSGLSNVVDQQYTANYTSIGPSTTVTLAGTGGGRKGDFIAGIFIVPSTVSPGAVSISDGGGGGITVFAGGANSVSNLVSFLCPLGIQSISGSWSITTGAAVSVLVTGGFT